MFTHTRTPTHQPTCTNPCTHPQMAQLEMLGVLFIQALTVYGVSTFHSLGRRCVYVERHVPSCASLDFNGWAKECDPRGSRWREVTFSKVSPIVT